MQPVAGYTEQTDQKVEMVNYNKQVEEMLLRQLEYLDPNNGSGATNAGIVCDPRWLSVAKTHFEQGFMALNRAVFQPQRVAITTPISYPADPTPAAAPAPAPAAQ